MSARAPRRALRRVIEAVALALALLFVGAVFVVPTVAGASTYAIMGRSMEPAIPLGALVVTRPTEMADVRVGDVVTFQLASGQPQVATHRVVGAAVDGDGARTLITQGDANADADGAPVTAAQLRGIVWYAVPLVGWLHVLTAGAGGWVMPAAVAALLGYAAWMFVSAWRSRRDADAPAGLG